MKCPKCQNIPLGYIYELKSAGVGNQSHSQGYLKCRHCDTLLKQERNRFGITKFEKSFWILQAVLLALVVPVVLSVNALADVTTLEYVKPGGLLLVVFGFLALQMHLIHRFAIYREVTDESEPERVIESSDTRSWVTLSLFAAVSLLVMILFVFLLENDLVRINKWIVVSGMIIYVIVSTFTGFYLLNRNKIRQEIKNSGE